MARIILIDDSSFQRSVVRRALSAKGHTIVEAATGEDGLAALATTEVDCVVLDLLMPGIGGVGVLENLGAQASKTPVLVLTADIQETTRQRCLELGAKRFLQKPLKAEELLSAIDEVVTDNGSNRVRQ